jgi:hypothetical protein
MNDRFEVTSANPAALCLLDTAQLSSTVVQDIRNKLHLGQFQTKVIYTLY